MPATIQNHIHLSITQSDVTSNLAVATWAISQEGYNPQPTVYVNFVRTFGGTLRTYVARTSGGAVVISHNVSLVLRLRAAHGETTQQRVDRLLNMMGKIVYYLPIVHDSASHSTGVKTMFIRDVQGWQTLDPLLENQMVQLFLEDVNP